ncbi:hypothetical protein LGH70_02970 [Hymenobacter sp. BT635]|uniref:Uncharacterized protein n=1 Tax=Hymenobacter nitidus TaxID=2880929 RepID=A0ABS8A7Z5_9BACT|nr:hypothetical protein [Hymenobacter nitidus]MCB2376526.1 hypothetical protein [Hymenobacter nitidus]
MKQLLRIRLLAGLCLSLPLPAWAGEKDEKASFLLAGGLGGLLIGAGLYAVLLGLAAVLIRRQAVLAALCGLCLALYGYIHYWSFYFLAIAVRFLRTRQMLYEFGTPTPLLLAGLAGSVAWALAALGLALWLRRRRRR